MNRKILTTREVAGESKQVIITACEGHVSKIGSGVLQTMSYTEEPCQYCIGEARAQCIAHAAKQPWFTSVMPSDVIYIAGPMTGHENYNRPAFWLMENVLRMTGCHILSPAHHPNSLSYEAYMRYGFEMVLKATALVMLKGWDKSNGACNEFTVANVIGTHILYEN